MSMLQYLKIIIVGALLIINQNAFAREACEDHQCKLIIDAGSSGSRVHLYAYDLNEKQEPINIKELYLNKVTPGFANLQDNEVDAYLTKLMQEVPQVDIEVLFYATAGMRLTDESRQQELYRLLQDWFNKNKKWRLRETRTITGKEEGVYAWVATNYSLGNFSSSNSFGLIEVGGASLQIVFPVVDTTNIPQTEIEYIEVGGRKLALLSRSFLGFGANEISKRFLDKVYCFPTGYQLGNNKIGDGNAILCSQEIADIINTNDFLQTVITPFLQNNNIKTWYTISTIDAISKSAPINTGNSFTIQSLMNQIDSFYCQEQWDLQKQNYYNKFLHQNCVVGAFFYSFTTQGCGMSPEQTINTFANSNNGDWALGALILH